MQPSCLGADHALCAAVTMPGGAKKFRPVHRYGKKQVKPKKQDNDVTMSLPMPAYQQPAVGANCVAGDGAPPARLSDRVRMDTRPVTTSDGAEASAHEQATLDQLESTRK